LATTTGVNATVQLRLDDNRDLTVAEKEVIVLGQTYEDWFEIARFLATMLGVVLQLTDDDDVWAFRPSQTLATRIATARGVTVAPPLVPHEEDPEHELRGTSPQQQ
jgi:hypothetical protein